MTIQWHYSEKVMSARSECASWMEDSCFPGEMKLLIDRFDVKSKLNSKTKTINKKRRIEGSELLKGCKDNIMRCSQLHIMPIVLQIFSASTRNVKFQILRLVLGANCSPKFGNSRGFYIFDNRALCVSG